jgi:DNA-binding MarR family transcriptional regulator
MTDVAAVRAVARLARVLERASGDLSMAHYRVLAAVADGDERASRVAARLALGKPTISASVDALCRRGLLTREDVVHDQRATTLRLTDAGATALHAAETAMTQRLAQVLAHTTRGAEAGAALRRIGAGLDHYAASKARQS